MAARKGNTGNRDRRLMTPLQRFLSFCRFDPGTGCVIWTGGTTSGRGHHSPYGSFWFEGRRWFAHRWAAKFIHGQEIDGQQVDHNCPHIPAPNTLCVAHVQAMPPAVNRELQWIRAQVGLDPCPPFHQDTPFIEPPFYEAPSWLDSGVSVDPSFPNGNRHPDSAAACPF